MIIINPDVIEVSQETYKTVDYEEIDPEWSYCDENGHLHKYSEVECDGSGRYTGTVKSAHQCTCEDWRCNFCGEIIEEPGTITHYNYHKTGYTVIEGYTEVSSFYADKIIKENIKEILIDHDLYKGPVYIRDTVVFVNNDKITYKIAFGNRVRTAR